MEMPFLQKRQNNNNLLLQRGEPGRRMIGKDRKNGGMNRRKINIKNKTFCVVL
jgi:hypothetical protein